MMARRLKRPMSDHEWYVDGSHESNITEKDGWADLKLICIDDHDCNRTATVMVKINPDRIRLEELEE